MSKWVVTSAWPYVNTVPHLGNMIGSVLSADVFARFLRMMGHKVVFVSGSDEHGTVIEVEAIKKGIHPKKLTDQAHEYIVKLWKLWNISFDNYTRTESEVHKDFVKYIMRKVHERGYIEKRSQIIPYCPKDKIYLPDRFIKGICPYCGALDARGDQCDYCGRLLDPQDLINPRCVFCGSRPVFKVRTHWFFRLDKLSDELLKWVESNKDLDEKVKNFTLAWIKAGLLPRSVTRDNKWGIEAPFPGAKGRTIYVWFDALLGYISATIEYFKKSGLEDKWKDFWLDPKAKTAYFIGKDNIPFHSIIFPAILLASGIGFNLPTIISATEYLLYEGQKFSKSRRVGIWIDEALKIVGEADYWRYALIRMRPEDKDSNFRWIEFVRYVNNELNDHIGNYIHRVLTLIWRHYEGVVPTLKVMLDVDESFNNFIESSWDKYLKFMYKARLRAASEAIVRLSEEGNKYLNVRAPWSLIRESPEEASTVLNISFKAVVTLTVMLYPIIPKLASKIIDIVNIDIGKLKNLGKPWLVMNTHHKIKRPTPPFRKLSKELVNALLNEDKRSELIEEVRKKVLSERPEFLR